MSDLEDAARATQGDISYARLAQGQCNDFRDACGCHDRASIIGHASTVLADGHAFDERNCSAPAEHRRPGSCCIIFGEWRSCLGSHLASLFLAAQHRQHGCIARASTSGSAGTTASSCNSSSSAATCSSSRSSSTDTSSNGTSSSGCFVGAFFGLGCQTHGCHHCRDLGADERQGRGLEIRCCEPEAQGQGQG